MTQKTKKKGPRRGHNLVGVRIREARHRLTPEVSQLDLAGRLATQGLELDRPTITRIENGQRYLRDYEILAIARALKVSVAWLFGQEKLGPPRLP
jgi:transcriptional regulator with XRE-family HTH domain